MEKREYFRINRLADLIVEFQHWEKDGIEEELIKQLIDDMKQLIFYEDNKENL